MAFGNGPRIVTSGLVLALDAADRNSYVSGSSVWKDLSTSSNNLSLALVSGSAFDNTNQGTIKFSGSSSFADISPAIDFANSAEFTLETVIVIPTFAQTINNVIYFIGSTGGNSMLLFYSNQLFMWNEGSNANFLSIPTTFNTNTPYDIVITRNSSNTVTLYVNGRSIGSGSRDGQFTWATVSRLGSALTLCSVVNISKLSIYNRALSAQEVLQNYNAQKSRFGL